VARILIVDDEPAVQAALSRLVQLDGHVAEVAGDADEARSRLDRGIFEVVLCDIHMPGRSGLDLTGEILGRYPDLAVVMISGADDPALADAALGLGAFGYIVKPFRDADVYIAVANALRRRRLEIENREHRDRLEQLVGERTAALERSRAETIHRLARAATMRDRETGHHIERVSLYCALIAAELGLPPARCELLKTASPLHDLGKIAIADSILRKPSRLDADERRVMMTHAELGHRLLADSGEPLLDLAAEIALNHHEHFDGSGYPRGIAGEEIPLEARILAVADVFDALTTDRIYRDAYPLERAVRHLRAGRGTSFDPLVVDALLARIDDAVAIRDTFRDEPQSRLAPAGASSA
jgi:putative two-component system response regulator